MSEVDVHPREVAGVLSQEVVLQRGLQGLPAGTGCYVPHCTAGAGSSGAGSWEDRSALFTASAYSSDVHGGVPKGGAVAMYSRRKRRGLWTRSRAGVRRRRWQH